MLGVGLTRVALVMAFELGRGVGVRAKTLRQTEQAARAVITYSTVRGFARSGPYDETRTATGTSASKPAG
jgi:hypothetical protein